MDTLTMFPNLRAFANGGACSLPAARRDAMRLLDLLGLLSTLHPEPFTDAVEHLPDGVEA